RGGFSRNDFCFRVGPIAKRFAFYRAGRDFHAAIIANAFHFSRVADGVDVDERSVTGKIGGRISRKPHRRFHALAALLERLQTQIFVIAKVRKSHGVAPVDSMHAIPSGAHGERASSRRACPLQIHDSPLASRLSPLASRLSPLASGLWPLGFRASSFVLRH